MDEYYQNGRSIDFRRLDPGTLKRYLAFHRIPRSQDMDEAELSAIVASHFEQRLIDEEYVLQKFLHTLNPNREYKPDPPFQRSSNPYYQNQNGMVNQYFASSMNPYQNQGQENRDDYNPTRTSDGGIFPSSPQEGIERITNNEVRGSRHPVYTNLPLPLTGELIAANVGNSDANGSWILGSIIKYFPRTGMFDVRDEDDTQNIVRLPPESVYPLRDDLVGLNKGDRVLAIFPETTAFYRSTLAKVPKTVSTHGLLECSVKFDDDIDASGKTPTRRVPAKYVINIPEHN